MRKLFIIGNGFDLAHELKTSYNDFKKFLLNQTKSYKFYDYDLSSIDNPSCQKEDIINFLLSVLDDHNIGVHSNHKKNETGDKKKATKFEEIEWNEFENDLGKLKLHEYFPENDGDNDSLNESGNVETAKIIQKFMDLLPKYFKEWVDSIRISQDKRCLDFLDIIDKDDFFLTFNYTMTLEKLYQVNNVLHIHGIQKQRENLVLGHKGTFDDIEDLDYIYPEAIVDLQSIRRFFNKDTSSIIDRYASFFSEIQQVKDVYSIGFSYSEADKAYIEKICSQLRGEAIVWHLCVRNDKDFYYQSELLRSCGFAGKIVHYYFGDVISRKEQHKLFVKTLSPYPFVKGASNNVYARVYQLPSLEFKGEQEYIGGLVHISLINQAMIEKDASYFHATEVSDDSFGNNHHKDYNDRNDRNARNDSSDRYNYYRPYFYEFTADVSCLTSEQYNSLKESQYEWKACSFESKGYNPNIVNERFSSKFYKGSEEFNSATIPLDGTVFFSASPFKASGKKLLFNDESISEEVLNKLDSLYDTSSAVKSNCGVDRAAIYSTFARILKSSSYKAVAFNVGQGNCVLLSGNANEKVYFDIGFTYRRNCLTADPFIAKAKKSISGKKVDAVILSHWDLDHILGVAYANKSVFTIPWLAVNLNEIKDVSTSAKRLAQYLHHKRVLYLLDMSFCNDVIFSNNFLRLLCGKGKDNGRNGGLNKANNFGIVIQTIGSDKMLLTGDCEYSMLPDLVDIENQEYKYLLVPHHGSRMPYGKLHSGIANSKKAIISVGHNSYKPKHPCKCHEDHLKFYGYNVSNTIGVVKQSIT